MAGKTLVFDVKVVDIQPAPQMPASPAKAAAPAKPAAPPQSAKPADSTQKK
jgi:FKBP-type peptidyl-prolyl cis-trans isomerase 2